MTHAQVKSLKQPKVFPLSISISLLERFGFYVVIDVLVFLYRRLGKSNRDLAITTKFSLGLLIATLGFLAIKFSTLFADANSQINASWLVLSMELFSLGELLISALGMAMVARIAPERMYGIMMGAWFLIASSLGSTLGGRVAILADIPRTLRDPGIILSTYGNIYFEIAVTGAIITVISFIVAPYIKRFADIS
jgi:POT family proton-dependent oligopeptide transporter